MEAHVQNDGAYLDGGLAGVRFVAAGIGLE
jgi:hypothetical protein